MIKLKCNATYTSLDLFSWYGFYLIWENGRTKITKSIENDRAFFECSNMLFCICWNFNNNFPLFRTIQTTLWKISNFPIIVKIKKWKKKFSRNQSAVVFVNVVYKCIFHCHVIKIIRQGWNCLLASIEIL